MAIEVLIKAEDNVIPDSPAPHMVWKSGQIICAKQSPADWGTAEVPPFFWRVTIEGIDMDHPDVEYWTNTLFDMTDPDNPIAGSQRPVRLDINLLPPPVRNDIIDDGYAIVSANRLQGFRDALVPTY